MEKVIRYVGIADCHGVESLQEIKSGPDAADKIKQEFYNLQAVSYTHLTLPTKA